MSRPASKTILLERAPREAHEPPELREGSRDAVRLLVSTAGVDHRGEHHHSRFVNLANFLEPRDLLVVNRRYHCQGS